MISEYNLRIPKKHHYNEYKNRKQVLQEVIFSFVFQFETMCYLFHLLNP